MMKPHEVRRKLREARIAAQIAMEDYIEGVRNAPATTLKQALLTARACTELLRDPESEYALGLLRDVENEAPFTSKL